MTLLPDDLFNPYWLEPVVELRGLTTQAGVIMEDKTRKVLWQRDPHTPRYPASTTKIMTTLLMLENMKPNDLIVAPSDVNKIGEASMNLKPGEKVRVKNMAYAMMLRSANDGCYAVAVTMDGSVAKFAKRMNERAKQMGCQNTNFANPNGLNNKTHTISAYDLCLIGREAMQREDFREVVKTKKKLIDRSMNFSDRWMISKNKMLWKDSSADGIKTGYTNPAGHTYVGSAKRGDTRILTSILNASSWQADHMAMLKWAFDHYETKKLRSAEEFDLKEIGGPEGIKVKPKSDIFVCVKKAGDRVTEVYSPSTAKTDVKAGDVIGHDVVTDSDGFVQKIELVVSGSSQSKAISKIEDKPTNRWALYTGLGAVFMVCGGFLVRSFLRSRPITEVPEIPHPAPTISFDSTEKVDQ